VTSLYPRGELQRRTGTSFAAAFVTGAIALLWSQFLNATAGEMQNALKGARGRRTSVAPPLLDTWGAYRMLTATQSGSET
jgi:subtilisin family serine protease